MKKQILVIHGGYAFHTYEEYLSFLKNSNVDFEKYRSEKNGWKRNLGKDLGENFEVILPDMPNKTNAKYTEWKIWFEKIIPFLNAEVILIGHSMGGIFLAKYLSEEKFPKNIIATFIVAAPYNMDEGREIAEFTLPHSINQFEKQGGKIFLYHSEDDLIVNFTELKKYQKDIKNKISRVFRDRGHFNQESFPELVDDIKNLF